MKVFNKIIILLSIASIIAKIVVIDLSNILIKTLQFEIINSSNQVIEEQIQDNDDILTN